MRTKGIFTVVQMKGFQAVYADHAVKFRKHAVQIIYDIIAAVKNVAGIQADADFII